MDCDNKYFLFGKVQRNMMECSNIRMECNVAKIMDENCK